jgi:hypothetical protein
MYQLNNDVLFYITTFLSPHDFYAYFETCKLFYNLKKKILKKNIIKNPPSYIISKSIKLLEWASLHPGFNYTNNISKFATKYDNIEIINYLFYKDCPFNYKSYIEAIKNENMDVILLLKENNIKLNNSVYITACKIGNLEILKFIDLKKIDYTSYMLNLAIYKSGNIDAVKWLIKKGCRPNNLSINFAILTRNFKILDYIYKLCLHDLSLPLWNYNTSVIAAEKGYIDILKWLKKKQCPMNINTTNAAYKFNHIKTLEWLVKNGCPVERNIYNYIFQK